MDGLEGDGLARSNHFWQGQRQAACRAALLQVCIHAVGVLEE